MARMASATAAAGSSTEAGNRAVVAIAWTIGLAAVLCLRFRGSLELYVAAHRWLASHGVPDALRNCDGLLWSALAAAAGAWLASRRLRQPPTMLLGVHRGRRGWPRVVAAAALPMVLGGLLLGSWRHGFADGVPWDRLFAGVVRAPIAEELLFRGLLVAVVAAAIAPGTGLLRASIAGSALAFASLHVAWTPAGIAAGWATLLVTAIGGVWYSWLLLRWQTLFVPLLLHAAMNLGWLLAAAEGGAGGGGLVENALRVATIAIATVGTIRGGRDTTTRRES